MVVLAAIGAVATIRLLRLPWWWLLFPPFVDGIRERQPTNLARAADPGRRRPHRGISKDLCPRAAHPDPALARGGGHRRTAFCHRAAPAVGLVYRAIQRPVGGPRDPIRWRAIGDRDAHGSSRSAIIALFFCGRERSGWLAVPVLWPATQWYYSTLALPALTPIAAALIAVPVPGFAVLAAVAVAVERRNTTRERLVAAWRPAPPSEGMVST